MMSETPQNGDLNEAVERLLHAAREKEKNLKEFMTSQPHYVFCKIHLEIQRTISLEKTIEATYRNNGIFKADYNSCPECDKVQAEEAAQNRLIDQGVPPSLAHCTLDNWVPDSPKEAEDLEAVRDFARKKCGFLIILGEIGTGKT